ncbi:MAG: nucleoside deaminase [Bacteroidota bacterium]
MLSIHSDEHFMRQAYRLAERAFEEDEIPIGAVIVNEGMIIGKGYNQSERLSDPTAHAEMIAITAACEYMGHKFLPECTLYVTIEPCPMCAGALRWAQIGRIVFGAPEPKVGHSRHVPSLLHPRTEIQGGIMEAECAGIMQEFFRAKRDQ